MLAIIINEIRSFLRNGSSLFFCILFPSLLTLFLGTFLEKIEVSDNPVGELSIVYCTENAFKNASVPFEEFIQDLQTNGVLTAEKSESAKQLKNAVLDGFSAAVELDGQDIIIYNGTNSIQNRTLKTLFNSYQQTAGTIITAAEVNPAVLQMDFSTEQSLVLRKESELGYSMMDYYAVAMIVMIIFMGGCIGGCSSYFNERKNCTIDRLNMSPVSKTAIFLGKIIGSLPTGFVQVLTVMFTSTMFFGAHYCRNIGYNVLLAVMLIIVALTVNAFGMIVSLFIPRINPYLIMLPFIWVMLFLSGTFARDIYIEGLSNHMPSYLLQKAAFDLTIFSRPEKAIHTIIISLLLLILFIATGTIKINIRRKDA